VLSGQFIVQPTYTILYLAPVTLTGALGSLLQSINCEK